VAPQPLLVAEKFYAPASWQESSLTPLV